MSRENIAFAAHDGTTLRGWLYTPDGKALGRGVVMSHGFSATKEMALDKYAEIFAAAGLHVLVYDHRGLGESDGEPRQLIDGWVQIRDMLLAIDWLAARPEIDPQRIGLWGSSYSGGLVLIAAAMDQRIAAVIANVPFAGWPGREAAPDAFAKITERVRNATIDARMMQGPLAVVTVPDGLPAVMPQADAAEWFLREGGRPGARWRNEVWFPAAQDGPDLDPAIALPHLQAPVLFIVATEDAQAPGATAKAAYVLAGNGSTLLEIEGHHFTDYGGAALQQAAVATIEAFGRWL